MDIGIFEESCCNCGITFWITIKFHNELVKCKNTFWCPNGHPQSYIGKTEAEKQREKTEQQREKTKQYTKWFSDEREKRAKAERSNIALRGVITKLKNKPKFKPKEPKNEV